MSRRTFLLLLIAVLLIAGAVGLTIINQQNAGYAEQINSYLTANPPP